MNYKSLITLAMTIFLCGCNDSEEIKKLQSEIKNQKEQIKKLSNDLSESNKKVINSLKDDLSELKISISKLSADENKSRIEIQRELLIGKWGEGQKGFMEFFEDGTLIVSNENIKTSAFMCGGEENIYSQWTILSDGRLKTKMKFKARNTLNIDILQLQEMTVTESELSLISTEKDGSKKKTILNRLK